MMKSKLFLAGLFLFVVNVTFAQPKHNEDKIDKELSICLSKAEGQTTFGMCDCTYKALDQWDKKLNTVYKKLQIVLDASQKLKLTEAQREWVKFRDKEIEFTDVTYGAMEGTMWRVVRAQRVMQVTKDRALDLEEQLSTITQS